MPSASKKGPRVAPRTQISVDSEPAVLSFEDLDDNEESDRREVFSSRQALSLGNGCYRTLPQHND